MPGERTPDGGGGLSRSSDDNISLREHMQRQLEDARTYTDTLHRDQSAYFERVINELRTQLNERYDTQTKAIEAARLAAEKAVEAALSAAEQAVAKAEIASDKRFESVNEFRAQLGDQARTFMGRDESISRHERTTEMIAGQTARYETETRLLRERFEGEIKTLRDRHDTDIGSLMARHEADMKVVNSRLDTNAGRSVGIDKAWGYLIAAAGLVATIVGLIAYAIGHG